MQLLLNLLLLAWKKQNQIIWLGSGRFLWWMQKVNSFYSSRVPLCFRSWKVFFWTSLLYTNYHASIVILETLNFNILKKSWESLLNVTMFFMLAIRFGSFSKSKLLLGECEEYASFEVGTRGVWGICIITSWY